MKKVLYISNIEVPYRTEFFNQLASKCDLTVIYERKKSSNRNTDWTNSVKSKYNIIYLKGIKIKQEFSFDFRIIKHIFSKKYDKTILGCYNSPSQILAIFLLRIFRKKYILNMDGEYFVEGNSIKCRLKRFILKGAQNYLVAGEQVKKNLSKYINEKQIATYYFSSLTYDEVVDNAKFVNKNRSNKILVIGQYFDYKGLDIALRTAAIDEKFEYEFIGSGNRSNLLLHKVNEMNLKNVKIIPFLSKEELFKKYQNCKMVLLPSKKECWGLVVNEAASFGCPIVSTFGSGAAIEFLKNDYKKFLAKQNDEKKIYDAICLFSNMKPEKVESYRQFLILVSSKYYIEKNVEIFMKVVGD